MSTYGVVEAYVREWDRWMRGQVLYIHESGHVSVAIGVIELTVPVFAVRGVRR